MRCCVWSTDVLFLWSLSDRYLLCETTLFFICRNYLLRLDLGNLEELEKESWIPTQLNQSICRAKGRGDVSRLVFVLCINTY